MGGDRGRTLPALGARDKKMATEIVAIFVGAMNALT
jgi:hypothetical protein